jgi:hypothetical protein
LAYEPSKTIVAWGIQVVDGLNLPVIVCILFLISIISGFLAVIYSACTKDVGGAFAIASFLVG